MRYSNQATRGGYFRGFDALNQKLGEEIWDQMLIHDDGQLGLGGTRVIGVGGQSGGKTTLNTKFARLSYYVKGMSKQEFFSSFEDSEESDWIKRFGNKIHPETILWRGREFDQWHILVPETFKKHYPNEVSKPLRVHVYKHSDLSFWEGIFNEKEDEIGELKKIQHLDIKKYTNLDQLYNNIIDGGNNIIYPPIKHFMSARLKDSINTKRNVSKRDRKYLSPREDYLVERDIFLFEIFEYLYRANADKAVKKWYTTIIDESHDLFRSNAPDVYYWVIECMVDVLVDTRKNNLSIVAMTHALNLLDYRILERASHFIWLRGSKPGGGYSTVDTRLIKKLKPGQGVNESIMDGLVGGFTFDRLPNNASRLVVQGLNPSEGLSCEIAEDEFAAVTENKGD